jgi:hypothetical protein
MPSTCHLDISLFGGKIRGSQTLHRCGAAPRGGTARNLALAHNDVTQCNQQLTDGSEGL